MTTTKLKQLTKQVIQSLTTQIDDLNTMNSMGLLTSREYHKQLDYLIDMKISTRKDLQSMSNNL